MGCSFCASGAKGFVRDLSAGEMVGQVLTLRSLLPEGRVSHLVLMGMGEPLDNLDAVLRFLEIAQASWGLGIGYRRMTLSTCGIVEGIDRLAQAKLPINLAVSLHAADDDLRADLMPIARRYSIAEVMVAARRFSDATGRRVTYEYALLDGVNDGGEDAVKLANLLRGSLAHVNLIPMNPVLYGENSVALRRSAPGVVDAFAEVLRGKGVEVTVRREMGMDISAACGQLRLSRGRDRLG